MVGILHHVCKYVIIPHCVLLGDFHMPRGIPGTYLGFSNFLTLVVEAETR